MAWGMTLPNGFGNFWPDGEFEANGEGHDGWRDRLADHYLAQTREEQKRLFNHGDGVHASSYASFVWGKFTNESGTTDRPEERPPFTPIELHEAPRSYTTAPYPDLGDLIMLNNRIIAVSENLINIIQRLEPGRHCFFPLDLKIMRRSARIESSNIKYFTMQIRNYLDSYCPENYDISVLGLRGVSLRKSFFAESHIWRERKVPALTCFSDELNSEIVENACRIPRQFQLREV